MQEPKLYILLENIRSAFNVGNIFRTADAAGNCHILLCGITPEIDNPKIYKTALGATKTVPSTYFPDPLDAFDFLEAKSVPIYSVELTADAEHFHKIEYPSPLALVLGHEIKGVSQIALDKSEKTVFIPMNGEKESLNVGNTTSIMIYEALRGKL